METYSNTGVLNISLGAKSATNTGVTGPPAARAVRGKPKCWILPGPSDNERHEEGWRREACRGGDGPLMRPDHYVERRAGAYDRKPTDIAYA